MAASKEDPNLDLTCIICCSLFKVPTTLPCGHTFCAACLETLWRQPGLGQRAGAKGFKCPICNKVYKTKPSLNKNTTLAALVERVQAAGGAEGEASCLDCAGDRVERLCLTCGDQYCAAHLSPHRQADHLLLMPLGAEVPWPCRGHTRPMEFYCPVHAVPVCAPCARQEEHASCQPALLLPRLKSTLDNQSQRLKDIGADINRKEQAILKWENESKLIQKSICELKNRLGIEFSEIKKYIEQLEESTGERIDQAQTAAQQKLKESITMLTRELAEQKGTKSCMEMSAEDNWLELLKNSYSTKDITSASVRPIEDISLDNDEIASLTTAVTELRRVILENTVIGQNILAVKPAETMSPSPSPPISSSLVANDCTAAVHECPSVKRPNEFVQSAVTITFDPETVSCCLVLENENSKVVVAKKKMRYPASPVRFISNQVLCSQGFSKGCHYWEIEMKACEGWAVGITNKNIHKKNNLGRTATSWCLEWSDKSLSAWHANQKIQITQPHSETIGVFLDCETHVLSFHSVADDFTLLHTYKGNFPYPVFPAFWLYGSKEGGSLTLNPIVKN